MSKLSETVDKALHEAGLAYEFNPSSYTCETYRCMLELKEKLAAWLSEERAQAEKDAAEKAS
jgi:hypothetical protein